MHLSQVHQPSKQWSSHRLHRFTQIRWLRKIVAEVSCLRNSKVTSTDCNFRGCTCLKCTNRANSSPPTDCTEFTEPSAEESLPQIARNSQIRWVRKIVAEVSCLRNSKVTSTDCNFRGCTCLKCTNRANSSPPTDCTEFTEPAAEESLPQIAQIYTDSLGAEDSSGGILPPQQQSNSHRLHGCNFRKGVKTQLTRAESPTSHSPGQRPGYNGIYMNNAPCKGNTLIIRLLPLQGVGGVWVPFTQGAALGYVLLPLRGVTLASFDTPQQQSDSHRWHRCNFRGCTCLRSALPLARARSAPTEQYRYTSCYVGALETSAPP